MSGQYVIGDGTYDYAHSDKCPAYGWHVDAPAVPKCQCNGVYSRGYDDGYLSALNDVREAVAALKYADPYPALAAIDALRGAR